MLIIQTVSPWSFHFSDYRCPDAWFLDCCAASSSAWDAYLLYCKSIFQMIAFGLQIKPSAKHTHAFRVGRGIYGWLSSTDTYNLLESAH